MSAVLHYHILYSEILNTKSTYYTEKQKSGATIGSHIINC